MILSYKLVFVIGVFIAGGNQDELDQYNHILNDLKANEISSQLSFLIGQIEQSFNDGKSFTPVDLSDTLPPAFDINTINKFIDTYKNFDFPIDEEFGALLAKCYSLDSKLFAKTLSDLNNDEINAIAESIVRGNAKIRIDKGSSLENFSIELNEQEQINLNNLEMEINSLKIKNDLEIYVSKTKTINVPTPTVTSISYVENAIEVNSPITLDVTISEPTQTANPRNYYVEIIHTRDGVDYIKAVKTITVPALSTSTTTSFLVTPINTGSFYTTVKVYSAQDDTLLTSYKDPISSTSRGTWRIEIRFVRDRLYTGTLVLYDANGTYHFSCSALGRSVSNAGMATYEGNTPIGPYTGWVAPPQPDTAAYGPNNVIIMQGASGNAYVPRYRDGIWIHGGRSQTTLMPTYGCVRVFDDDISILSLRIVMLMGSGHAQIGNINITETNI